MGNEDKIAIMLVVIIEVVFNILIFKFIIKVIMNIFKKKDNKTYFKNNVVIYKRDELIDKQNKDYIDIDTEQLKEFNTEDLETFKNYFYKIFVDFENAYNSLDYNTMKSLSTNQLYENYYTGITLDLSSGNKRIIDNIQKKKVICYETLTTTLKQVVSCMIEISYINYMINKSGQIISGSRDNKITEKFEVTFRKEFRKEFKKDDVEKCPNCGASVVGNKCEFCRTNIKSVEFRISNIKKIIEK